MILQALLLIDRALPDLQCGPARTPGSTRLPLKISRDACNCFNAARQPVAGIDSGSGLRAFCASALQCGPARGAGIG